MQAGVGGCTGCETDSDADYIHPKLKVPICGACYKAYHEGIEFDDYKKRMNMIADNARCLWCSDMDSGLRLFLCDSCTSAFCYKCVHRNFGVKECTRLENDSSLWSCYYCVPNPIIIGLQRRISKQMHNIEFIYSQVLSPTQLKSKRGETTVAHNHMMNENINDLFNQLSVPEKNLAAIFSDYFISSSIANLRYQILNYTCYSFLISLLTQGLRTLDGS